MEIVMFLGLLFVCVFVVLPIWIVFKIRRITALEDDVRRVQERLDTFSETLVAFERHLRQTAPAAAGPMPRATPAPVVRPAPKHVPPPPVDLASPVVKIRPAPVPPWSLPTDMPSPPQRLPREQPLTAFAVATSATGETILVDDGPTERRIAVGADVASLELEETLGTNWLNKLGALLLVVGATFFLTQQVRAVGPLGKDAIGLAVGVALLASGFIAERRTAYAMFSRGVMAAGWGLVFFTTFAMHHVAAARVIDSEALDLALMLVVAGGMVGHALRYRSEAVTTLAFVFAFGTVAISHDTAFTLSACAVLAVASSAIAVRLRWHRLELAAIAGTFLNHYLWLPVLARSEASVLASRAALSLAMLSAYWVTFRAAYIVRRDSTDVDERWSAVAAIVSTAGLIVVAARHPLSDTTIFLALLTLGAVDALCAHLVHARRLAFVTLTTMGAALVAAAFPVRYGAHVVSVAWLIEAQALVMVGVRTRDGLFTRLGQIGLVLAAIHITVADVGPVLQARQVAAGTSAPGLALLLLTTAAVFYTHALWTSPKHPQAFASPAEQTLARDLSFVGMAALLAAAWAFEPGRWMAPLLMGVAVSLLFGARRLGSGELWLQAQAASACALARVLGSSVGDGSHIGRVEVRAIVLALGAAEHHLLDRYGRMAGRPEEGTIATTHAWAASALLMMLAWYELAPLQVALAWAAGGVLLLELGQKFGRSDWRLQALAAWVLAFVRIFVVNLNAGGGVAGPASIATIPLAAIFYYGYERLDRAPSGLARRVPELLAAAGTITIAAVCRTVLTPPLVVVAWGVLAVLTSVLARVLARREFLTQSSAVGVAVAAQAILVNLYGRSYFEQWWTRPALTVGVASALVLTTLPLARREHGQEPDTRKGHWYRADYVPFFVPLLLATWTTAVTLEGAAVTVAWGVTAVAAFVVALWLRERVFRLSALALLLGSVVRIVAADVWRLQQQGRYVTFMTLGAALLLVSFLYSRYRERMREYL